MKKIFANIRRHFFEGLLIFLALSITILILGFVINLVFGFVNNWMVYFVSDWDHSSTLHIALLYVIAIAIALIIIVILGYLGSGYLGKIFHKIAKKFQIPIFSSLYSALKSLLAMFISPDKNKKFNSACLIRYPQKDILSIAFITNDSSYINPEDNERYICVFMPSTPNPTTGYLMFIKYEDVIMLDMPIDQAFKTVISAGILQKDKEEEI